MNIWEYKNNKIFFSNTTNNIFFFFTFCFFILYKRISPQSSCITCNCFCCSHANIFFIDASCSPNTFFFINIW